ncbi:MAG: phage holin family protein [Buchananella hordeovulneris]|nr:phage holin family protein [Buchananella hordeovulneris]
MKFLIRVIGNAAGLWLAAQLISGVTVAEHSSATDQVVTYAVIAAVLTLFHSLLKGPLKFLSFPLYILTFGLFALVINAALLGLTAKVTSGRFDLAISGFWPAVGAALIIAVISAVVQGVLRPAIPNRRR